MGRKLRKRHEGGDRRKAENYSFEAFLEGQLEDPRFRRAYENLELALQLMEARTRARISQAELARRTGLNKRRIHRFEAAWEIPTIPVLRRIAHVLNCQFNVTIRP